MLLLIINHFSCNYNIQDWKWGKNSDHIFIFFISQFPQKGSTFIILKTDRYSKLFSDGKFSDCFLFQQLENTTIQFFFNIRFSKLEGSKHINDISVRTKAWKKGHFKSYKWNFYLHDKNFRLRHFWAHRVHFITSGETWDIKIRILNTYDDLCHLFGSTIPLGKVLAK